MTDITDAALDALEADYRSDTAVHRLVRSLVAALRSERTQRREDDERWQEWSNSIADRMPEHYDGDDAQEAIIDRWLDDTAAELERERTQNREPTEAQIDETREAVLDGLRRLAVERGQDIEQGVDEFTNDEYRAVARAALSTQEATA